jgi:hypothetical protein
MEQETTSTHNMNIKGTLEYRLSYMKKHTLHKQCVEESFIMKRNDIQTSNETGQ